MLDRLRAWIRGIDPATGKPRLIALQADKVTELHRTGQAVGLIVMEEGELKSSFFDYRHVKGHTGKDLARDLVDGSLRETLKLSTAEIRQQLVTGAFDGQYFALNVPAWISAHILRPSITAGLPATDNPEVEKLTKWLACAWDYGHRAELACGSVRDDRPGVGVELDSVSWYMDILKDIGKILACFSYGKGYEAILEFAELSGNRLYRMNRYQDTRWAQAERKV